MKTMKLIYPLAFALALTLATTGCKPQACWRHDTAGPKSGTVGDNQPGPGDTLPPGGAMNPDNGANANGIRASATC